MSPQKLDKKGLDDNLSYYINNKNDVSVIVYAILKNSPIAYRMDIEGSAQNGLKELFLDSLKEILLIIMSLVFYPFRRRMKEIMLFIITILNGQTS